MDLTALGNLGKGNTRRKAPAVIDRPQNKEPIDRLRNAHVKNFDPADYDIDGVTPQELCDFKEAFDLFDSDGNESIDPEEIITALKDLNVPFDPSVIEEFFQSSSSISFRQMMDLMIIGTSSHTSNEIGQIFELFDGTDKGFIDIEDLKRVAKTLGKTEEEGTLEEMINSVGDSEGRVKKEDLVKLFTRNET